MRPARDLTGRQLAARLETLSARASEINDVLIAAGRGLERPSDIRGKSDPLSVRFNETSAAYRQASDERARRMTYHGTLRPIRSQGY